MEETFTCVLDNSEWLSGRIDAAARVRNSEVCKPRVLYVPLPRCSTVVKKKVADQIEELSRPDSRLRALINRAPLEPWGWEGLKLVVRAEPRGQRGKWSVLYCEFDTEHSCGDDGLADAGDEAEWSSMIDMDGGARAYYDCD